ncbi:ATP-dependent DNA helicase MER3 [Ophidiomyces ophidiicola]|nr:ATP-dependent DNA helicase MER3 [Ophidiomyces ophidiicola]
MGSDGKTVPHLLSTFRYPATNRSKISYGINKRGPASQTVSPRRAWPTPGNKPSIPGVALMKAPFEEDDLAFDAFDRELLAQLEHEQLDVPENGPNPFSFRGQPYTPNSKLSSSNLRSSATAAAPTASFRGVASSPSDAVAFGSPLNTSKTYQGASVSEADFCEVASPHWPKRTIFSSPHTPCPPGSATLFTSASPSKINLSHAPPIIQGIQLVSTHDLPDRFRSIFPFSVFNAIQSKSFDTIYHTDDNFVLSAPTGSGKTVVMELAICRLLSTIKDSRFKVVYQAPTKSLCSERFRDWRAKFSSLDLQCAELTGDTDQAQMRNVQHASIIITTPEKWDSMTRKWKDHSRLMQLIKLFLIDEVHILKEARGATLEAVVSRMKSVDSNVRFVALSATVPNSEDIAAWLGRDPTNQHLPACRERFGEEFRPVKLQKFVYGYQSNGNDFVFDKICDSKLPEVISKHSQRKPIMIFCCTRNSAIATAKNLTKLWTNMNAPHRLWNSPKKSIIVQNQELQATVSAGVAFHHAGLDASDRHTVESGYLEGNINVICCTSTLAVGVNLPCHLVVIKNTVSWQDNCCKEYADLEMMQMLGRAGRPQFDDSAVAVILTKKERVSYYQKLAAGSEPLESCLHVNLIDHLNAEIGLGTVRDLNSATRWLSGTFFFIRLQKNPTHYQLKDGCDKTDEEELMRQTCAKGIELLQECSLITPHEPFKSTEFGDAMARYYVKFETMKLLMALPSKAKISEILSAMTQADEFRDIRLKAGEKSLYKEINKGNGIKFPIKIDIGVSAHKISLLIQSELGGVEIPTGEQFQKHRLTFQQDKNLVFSHVSRLIRCIIDCQISRGDSVAARNALELARGFGARVWDNSPLQMKQIDQIGLVAVRKLASAGITSIESLEAADAQRIDMILSKNPPFGLKLLGRLAEFPKPRVSLKMIGKETKPGKCPIVKFKADIGFINEKPPTFFHRKPVFVCFLAETSDGRIIDFRRISANKLQCGHEIALSAELLSFHQYITCYIMCDEIAGTLRQAELKPKLPESLFPRIKDDVLDSVVSTEISAVPLKVDKERAPKDLDEFSDECFDDHDFIAAVESLDIPTEKKQQGSFLVAADPDKRARVQGTEISSRSNSEAPLPLSNGKWECNHRCKDKAQCKHLCCREGIDRPPKGPKNAMNTKILETRKEPNTENGEQMLSWKNCPKLNVRQKSGVKNVTNPYDGIDVIDLTSGSTTIKHAPRYKYVKKRNEKDNDICNPFAPADDLPTKPTTTTIRREPNASCFYSDSTSEDELNANTRYSRNHEGNDMPGLFSPETTFVKEETPIQKSVQHILSEPFDYEEYYNHGFGDVTDTHETFENELTDYDQYVSSADKPIQNHSDDGALAVESSKSETHSSMTNTATLPPSGADSLSDIDNGSEPLFCWNSQHDKTKRARGNEELNKDTSGQDAKRPKLYANDNSKSDLEAEGWEGIDLALLEEFKDVVELF